MTLRNLIPSSSMEGGGWNGGYSSDYALIDSRSLKVTAAASQSEQVTTTSSAIPLVSGHVYYARVYGYQVVKTNGATVGFYWPIAEPPINDHIAIEAAGQWNFYSAVNNRASFSSGNYQFRIDFNNNKVAGTIYFDGCMLIDLTAAFGSGHEPGQAWCDALPYFADTLECILISLPEITSCVFSTNPVYAGGSTLLSVAAGEITKGVFPQPIYSGEFYSGEI